jgi:pimeloyl-ACP methyl ester carboxylesterase
MTEGPRVPPEAVESMRREEYWPSLEAAAHTLAYDGTVMGDTMSGSPEPLERWASLDVPTLVMAGGASPPWQRAAVGALASVLPDARHLTLADQDHGPADEVLAPVLAEFFAG